MLTQKKKTMKSIMMPKKIRVPFQEGHWRVRGELGFTLATMLSHHNVKNSMRIMMESLAQ